MTHSAQEARNTIVFVLNYKGDIEQTNLYDHVVESAEKTTSPRGVMHKLFIEQDRENDRWLLKLWGSRGQGPAQLVASFETKEEAENEWFTRTYNYDFMEDDQRDTNWYPTREEAERHVAELYPNPEQEEE
jgi:hypothetical protein